MKEPKIFWSFSFSLYFLVEFLYICCSFFAIICGRGRKRRTRTEQTETCSTKINLSEQTEEQSTLLQHQLQNNNNYNNLFIQQEYSFFLFLHSLLLFVSLLFLSSSLSFFRFYHFFVFYADKRVRKMNEWVLSTLASFLICSFPLAFALQNNCLFCFLFLDKIGQQHRQKHYFISNIIAALEVP